MHSRQEPSIGLVEPAVHTHYQDFGYSQIPGCLSYVWIFWWLWTKRLRRIILATDKLLLCQWKLKSNIEGSVCSSWAVLCSIYFYVLLSRLVVVQPSLFVCWFIAFISHSYSCIIIVYSISVKFSSLFNLRKCRKFLF